MSSYPNPPYNDPNQRKSTSTQSSTPSSMPPQSYYGQPYMTEQYAPPPQPRQPKRASNRTLWWVVGGAVVFGIIAFVGIIGLILMIYAAQPRVADNVSVAGIGIGGQTMEAAAQALDEAFQGKEITVTDNDRNWRVSLASIGVSIDAEQTVAQAENAADGTQLAPMYTIDLTAAHTGFMTLSQQTDIEPVSGNPPTPGRIMDIPFVLDRLRQNVNGELADGVLDLSMIEVEAELDETAEYTGTAITHVVETGDELGLIAKRYGVDITEIVNLNGIDNPDLLYVGQELKIPAAGEYIPTGQDAPQPSTSVGKAIVVSLDHQRIYAFQDGELVRSHLVSTGLPATPTVKGDFKVYIKYEADDMSGPDYFLPQVPFTMYFYQGYAIHGTYWHSKFGRVMSHGCVNLPTDEAQWFFNFAEVGTPVRVV